MERTWLKAYLKALEKIEKERDKIKKERESGNAKKDSKASA